jgi:hypothetical protein
MATYKIEKDGNLKKIEERKFKLEKELQELTEKNMESILGLQFVRSEFSVEQLQDRLSCI